MNNSHMLSLIERKLTNEDRKIWLRQQKPPTLKCLMEWLSQELQTRIRATASIREGRSDSKPRQGAFIHHLTQEDKGSDGRKPDFKCWLCKSNDHWIDKCQKVVKMSQQERYELMKENRACFSCLKRAGKEHRMTTCRRRKKCDRCSSFHHPLLHSTIKIQNLPWMLQAPDRVKLFCQFLQSRFVVQREQSLETVYWTRVLR